jgi:MFS family permease
MQGTDPSHPRADEDPSARRPFGQAFWMCNVIEMWERLAYFSVRVVAPIYIMQADDPGGLHLSAAHKGSIYAWWFIFQSILPTFTGGFADRYGYKRTLAFAVSMNCVGYVLMAFCREYWTFFLAVMVLATGTAFFKPSLQGTLAANLTKSTSSLGWGIFYWVVNIGGLFGPFVATLLLGDQESRTPEVWRNVFLASAAITSLNLVMLFTFRDVPSGASKTEGPIEVFVRTIRNIAEPRLVAWLLIMSGFWLMMYQLWDLHPNFIQDWVDSRMIAERVSHLPEGWRAPFTERTTRGVLVPQQMLLNFNAFLIVLCVIPMSWLVRRLRTLTSMLIGMTVATVGIVVAGLTANGGVLLLGIAFFSFGEMLTGPKKNEYLGLIAPPGKKGLYLGYVNIPVGIGGFVGSKLAGYVYGHWGEKATLALRYLAEHTPVGVGKEWDGRVATLEDALGLSRTDAVVKLQEVAGLDAQQVTQLLWETYSPQYAVWLPFAAIGVVAAIALAIFGQMAKRWSDLNA